ncbi:hypothetical protein [Thiolinea disciformis]|uniref:hypothetical protein n=1 Tax=Thiolinea disciformis TaxID=125614 RepID=UPI00035DC97C|nr:hypothetical protein [Thiolinea disciformis]
MSNPGFHQVEQDEESFWPSLTDMMLVIVMVFLLVVVAVVLTNTQLMDKLRHSVMAEQKASQLAEFTLKENATLEEQLDYYKRLASASEMELLESRAANEKAELDLSTLRSQMSQAQAQASVQANSLQQREQQITSLQAELGNTTTELSRLRTELGEVRTQLSTSQALATERETALNNLRQQTEKDREALVSLKGDFAALDSKYQKLLKPTRSAKDKTVVEVVYQRSGYQIRVPGDSQYRSANRSEIEAELSDLKAKHGANLYVKIVIPSSSGLSYNEAWVFTRDMLNKYDYYYQTDSSIPVPATNANTSTTQTGSTTPTPITPPSIP